MTGTPWRRSPATGEPGTMVRPVEASVSIPSIPSIPGISSRYSRRGLLGLLAPRCPAPSIPGGREPGDTEAGPVDAHATPSAATGRLARSATRRSLIPGVGETGSRWTRWSTPWGFPKTTLPYLTQVVDTVRRLAWDRGYHGHGRRMDSTSRRRLVGNYRAEFSEGKRPSSFPLGKAEVKLFRLEPARWGLVAYNPAASTVHRVDGSVDRRPGRAGTPPAGRFHANQSTQGTFQHRRVTGQSSSGQAGAIRARVGLGWCRAGAWTRSCSRSPSSACPSPARPTRSTGPAGHFKGRRDRTRRGTPATTSTLVELGETDWTIQFRTDSHTVVPRWPRRKAGHDRNGGGRAPLVTPTESAAGKFLYLWVPNHYFRAPRSGPGDGHPRRLRTTIGVPRAADRTERPVPGRQPAGIPDTNFASNP